MVVVMHLHKNRNGTLLLWSPLQLKIVVVVFSVNVLFNPQIGGLSGFYCGLNCAKWKPKGFYTEIRTVEPEFLYKRCRRKGNIFRPWLVLLLYNM